ncbi:hypothetical protein [Barrientosiimonas humi]|uniref:hypothetical protein n=1 Tax=Barrientosiimonas humi TaxID=999931 RepID=UPI0011520EFB|nr:hypothetical protein [Barrientosiimonas humi]
MSDRTQTKGGRTIRRVQLDEAIQIPEAGREVTDNVLSQVRDVVSHYETPEWQRLAVRDAVAQVEVPESVRQAIREMSGDELLPDGTREALRNAGSVSSVPAPILEQVQLLVKSYLDSVELANEARALRHDVTSLRVDAEAS